MIQINYDKLTQIKRIDLPQYLKTKGIDLSHNGNGRHIGLCPFHRDTKPSLSVSFKQNKWLWHCFGCGKSGTIIEFTEALEHKPFAQVYTELLKLTNENTDKKISELLADIVKIYHNNLKASKIAQGYLEKRGLLDKDLIDTFMLGFANGNIKELLPNDSLTKQLLQEISFLNEKGNECYYNCITVPLLNKDDQIVGLYGRRINDFRPKHLYLKGEHKAVFNYKAAKIYDSLILTEAIIDALSLYKHGFKNVIAAYGNNGFTKAHLNILKENKTKEVFLAYDNDEVSDEASRKLAQSLTSVGIVTKRVHLPEGIKDINQYFNYTKDLDFKGTKDTFAYLLEKAPKIGYSLSGPLKKQGLIAQKDLDFHFVYGRLEYNIHLIDQEEASSLRVVVTAKDNQMRHTDKFDLYSQKARKIFENIASKKFNLCKEEVEHQLLEIIKHLETYKQDFRNPTDEPQFTMSEEDREKALAYLKDPNLIANIIQDIEKIGYIGEDTNKLIAYLVASSRKLRQPLSSIIVSQSATGKSYLMEKIASLMPEEEVEFYSRLTPQSLYYMEPDQLKHKLLIVDERSGSEEADYAIRSLQTRHKLSLAYPLKDPVDGKLKTIVVQMQGPIAFMESSTKAKFNIENTTRSFMLYLDETEKQTRQIHAHQRFLRTLAGKESLKRIPGIIKLHQNLQRLLKPVEIIIDFKNLDFPSSWIRTRRDQERFLSLIEAVTYLHQYQRKIEQDARSNTEYIKATPKDYRIAYNLAKIALQDALSDLPKPTAAFFNLLDEAIAKKAKDCGEHKQNFLFRRRNIREWLNLPDHVVKRQMKLLEDLEYVCVKRDPKNGYLSYTLPAENIKNSYLEAITPPDSIN